MPVLNPTRTPLSAPSHQPTHNPTAKPIPMPIPAPTSPFPTRPPHPFPTHYPTALPSLFEDIHIYTPVADTYNYALQMTISWKTQGAGAIADCGNINVELYQEINGHDSFVVNINMDYPNDYYVSKC